jgi:hypothetical protein
MKFPSRLANWPKTHVLDLLVLLILQHLGGKASTTRVFDYLEKILAPAFESEDIEPEYRNGMRIGAHRWHHYIHATVALPTSGLRSNGYVLPARADERGIWTISDKGRQRVQTLLKTGRDPHSGITLAELTQSLDIPFLKGPNIAPPPPGEPPVEPTKRTHRARGIVTDLGEESRQSQILAEEITHIREFLDGNSALHTSDETLCDWIGFCYRFELFAEGAALFPHIHPEFVNPWFYERTKKLADICALRKA